MNKKVWKIVGIILYILSIAMLIRSVTLCFETDIWYDEVFSVKYGLESFDQMIADTACDVHPPLYYILLNVGILIGQNFGMDPVYAAKTVSVVPYIIICLYSAFFVRKRWGWICAGLLPLMLVGMPQMSEYTVEIRMYSWAMFFVLAFFMHAYGIIENTYTSATNKKILIHSVPLVIYGIAAFYTHYYAVMAIFFMYLFLIIWTTKEFIKTMKIKQNKGDADERIDYNFRAPATALIGFNMALVSFVPWISVVVSQVKSVASSYWIQPVSFSTLGGIVKYLCKPEFSNEILNNIIAVVLFFMFLLIIIVGIKKLKKNERILLICGFGSFVLVVFAGLFASVILRPVFIYRYMIPALGFVWLPICILIATLIDSEKGVSKTLSITLAGIITIVCIRDYYAFRGNELYKKVNMELTQNAIDEIADNYDTESVKIVCNFNQIQALMYYYLEEYDIYLYGSEIEGPYKILNPKAESFYDVSQISKWLDKGEKVLFLGSFNARDEILENFYESEGIENTETGSYLLERYWFNIYELYK
ncbi:MAG: hypothetical protein K6B41_08620 [Butyrivibrio sp.]|nr:hypothetical protein [Butyrivibrio sp.]